MLMIARKATKESTIFQIIDGLIIPPINNKVIVINLNKSDSGNTPPTSEEQEKTREEQLTEATNMTGEQAIEIVKENFGSDNYEFRYEVTEDSFYKVIVTNIVDDSEIIYYVDPTNGKAYIDMDTE